MNFKAIIIDDDEFSLVALDNILKLYCPDINVVGTTTSSVDAVGLIRRTKPDIVFLDIQMPVLNGFELLKSLPDINFDVVIISAHNHYAVEAFKVNAIDFILKPISVNDIISTVNRVVKFKDHISNSVDNLSVQHVKKIAIPSVDGAEYINASEIIHIEADNGYSNIFLDNRKITSTKRLKEIGDVLCNHHFFRTHKSNLVNLEQVVKYDAKNAWVEMVNGEKIPISRRNKENFIDAMSKLLN